MIVQFSSFFDTRPPNMAIVVLPSNVERLSEQDGTSALALINADSPHSSAYLVQSFCLGLWAIPSTEASRFHSLGW